MSTEPEPIRVYLAGGPAVARGDVLVPERAFPGPQGRIVFARLALERTRAVSHDELVQELWGDSPPRAWETALRALVSKLRATLAPVGLDGTDALAGALGVYQLRLPADAWIDLEAADDAAHRAESALRKDDLESANGWAMVAAAITSRPFLPDALGPWAEAKRSDIAAIRVRALECRGEVLLRRGDPALAARDAEAVVELEPFRETGYALLMRAHVAAGNPAEALLVYERCRRILADELGTDPSRPLSELHRELLVAQEGAARR